MTSTRQSNHDFWQLLDELRRDNGASKGITYPPNLVDLLKITESRGIRVTADDIAALPFYNATPTLLSTPRFIADFIVAYLEAKAPNTIVDPYARTGSLLARVLDGFPTARGDGINENGEVHQAALLLHEEKAITWHLGDPFERLDDLTHPIDVIVCNTPWGSRHRPQVAKDPELENVRDEYGRLLMLKSARLLTPDGVGFFVVSPSFFWRDKPASARANLGRFGLYLDAALFLPNGTFAPVTSLPGYLVVISRTPSTQLFVGELTADPTVSRTVLDNLRARQPGKLPQLGTMVEATSFTSFPTLTEDFELDQLARKANLRAVSLGDIAVEIRSVRPAETRLEKRGNAFYMPAMGPLPAAASLAEIASNRGRYFRVALHEDKANAVYVARFLNTPLGHRVRSRLVHGTTARSVSRSALSDAVIYLPDIATQNRVVDLENSIANVVTDLEQLRNTLWDNPRETQPIEEAVRRYQQPSDAQNWLDDLPFPLASIIWLYHTAADDEKREDHLLHFFEALAQFVALIMLGGALRKPDLFLTTTVKEKSTRVARHPQAWAPTFGTWTTLVSRMGEKIRRALTSAEPDVQASIIEAFGQLPPAFLSTMASTDLYQIMDEARLVRNTGDAHGGLVAPQVRRVRVTYLEDLLSKSRRLLASLFSSTRLIQSRRAEFEDGTYIYDVCYLHGRYPPFPPGEVRLLAPLNRKRLYLLADRQGTAFELPSLLRLEPGPLGDPHICYYFNKLESGEMLWKSYHHPLSDELRFSEPDMLDALVLAKRLS